jgi:hypothetical protein
VGRTDIRSGTAGAGALVLALVLFDAAAGQSASVSGRVRTEAGRGVSGAAVFLRAAADTTVRAAETNDLGRFRVPAVPPGLYTIEVVRLGFAEYSRELVADQGDMELDIVLEERAIEIGGVVVEVDRQRARFERDAGATARELTREELKLVPGVAESDVLRAIEVLPGVVSTSDYTSAFNVRGGAADQNLILIDGFPIYNPFHLGGLFSVFNADVISRAELLAGGFPARYGGRVSSVLSVESDASGTGTTVDGGISLLAARAAVGFEVPEGMAGALGLRTARARVSARRSYFDQVLRPFFEFPYHLTDLQAFAEGWTQDGSRWTFTAYTGRDVLDFSASDSFPLRIRWTWGNDVVGLRYASAMGGGRTMEARVGYSRFATAIRFPDFGDTDFRSRIGQLTTRLDFDLPVGDVRFGAGFSADRVAYDNLAQTGGTEFRRGRDAGWLSGVYGQLRWDPGDWLIEAGGRVDAWSEGALDGGSPAVVWAPRLAVKRFLPGGDVAIKAAVGRYSQFLHSVRDEELPLGIDVWVLSGDRAPRIISNEVLAGIEAFIGGGWFTSLEVYDRRLDGVATNNFADDPNDPFDDLLAGKGRSYGADFQVRLDGDDIRPSIALSWLRVRRRFPDTTAGEDPPPGVEYPPIFDRRIDLEVMLDASLPWNVRGALRWNYGGGLPYTRPVAGYIPYTYRLSDGQRTPDVMSDDDGPIGVVLGPRNSERYPDYHRLDMSFRRTSRTGWGELTLYLDVLNVYNRKNPLFFFYEYNTSPPQRAGVSMFPLLPTFGAEFSF